MGRLGKGRLSNMVTGDKTIRLSVKAYLDELIDSVQDFDNYVGTSSGKICPIRKKRFEKAKRQLRNHIFELRRKVESYERATKGH